MLIDSNLIVYATQPAYPRLHSWILTHLPKVSVISRVEVLGFHRLQADEKSALESLFESLELLYPGTATFDKATELRQRRKLSLGDALIAATALEHGLTLATRNTTDFQWIDELSLIDPLTSPITPPYS